MKCKAFRYWREKKKTFTPFFSFPSEVLQIKPSEYILVYVSWLPFNVILFEGTEAWISHLAWSFIHSFIYPFFLVIHSTSHFQQQHSDASLLAVPVHFLSGQLCLSACQVFQMFMPLPNKTLRMLVTVVKLAALVYQRSYILNQEGSVYMWSKETAHQKLSWSLNFSLIYLQRKHCCSEHLFKN